MDFSESRDSIISKHASDEHDASIFSLTEPFISDSATCQGTFFESNFNI